MISIDKTLISQDVVDVKFCCDLDVCKGICCVEGDAGAPISEEEIGTIEDLLDEIKPYMTEKGVSIVEKTGVFDYDSDGTFVTALIEDRDCVFITYENGIAACAIEKAYFDKKIDFRKPISCHLYPVRLKTFPDGTVAVNYQKWHICESALVKGKVDNVPLYIFLKDSLIRQFGEQWYETLVESVEK